MLQFIVQFLPLIFLCAAFGVVLLNFDSVAAYIVYVISMLIQPKELLHATNEMSALPVPTPEQKKQFSIKRPFIRIWTLFIVLFFPSIDVEKITGKKTKKAEAQVNVYLEKTQEVVNKYRIKTYSVPSSDTSSFRSAMEPIAPLSSPFQQAFPDVVNILNKINKIENPVTTKPQIEVASANNITDTLPEFKSYDSSAVVETTTTTTSKPAAFTQPTHVLASKPLPKETGIANEPKFDAIAALEKKVSELKKDSVKAAVSKVDYAQMTEHSSDINNGKNFNITLNQEPQLPKLEIKHTEIVPEEAHVFKNNSDKITSSFNIFTLISKILFYTILSLPLLLVIGSVVYYLMIKGFDLTSLGGYPGWVTSSLENFVKVYIIKES
jgi:hypothetical protein